MVLLNFLSNDDNYEFFFKKKVTYFVPPISLASLSYYVLKIKKYYKTCTHGCCRATWAATRRREVPVCLLPSGVRRVTHGWPSNHRACMRAGVCLFGEVAHTFMFLGFLDWLVFWRVSLRFSVVKILH